MSGESVRQLVPAASSAKRRVLSKRVRVVLVVTLLTIAALIGYGTYRVITVRRAMEAVNLLGGQFISEGWHTNATTALLHGDEIDDQRLATMAEYWPQITSLKYVQLGDNGKISDQGVLSLNGIPNLQVIQLGGLKPSSEVLDKLRAQHPDLQIEEW